MRGFFLACLVTVAIIAVIVVIVRNRPPAEGPRILLGVWQPGSPADLRPLRRFERFTGKKVAIVQFYYDWNHRLDPKLVENVLAYGAVPLITWEPQSGCDEILAGRYDRDIERWARDLGALKNRTPILLRTMHEMNISGYPWSVADGGCTADTYIRAWKHFRRIFDQNGASNVQHVWCPNVYWDENTRFDDMYPGDAVVDWVGLDGYNWGNDNWLSFGELFRASYDMITALSERPLIIAEVASHEDGDGGVRKAAWIRDAFRNELPSMPRVRAIVWFNEEWEDHALPVTSSRRAAQAFADSIADPRYLSEWPAEEGPISTAARP